MYDETTPIRPSRAQQGLSLLQLMALLAAIGLIAGLAVPKLLNYFS